MMATVVDVFRRNFPPYVHRISFMRNQHLHFLFPLGIMFMLQFAACNTTDPTEILNLKSVSIQSSLNGGTEGTPGQDYRFEAVHSTVTIPLIFQWTFDDSVHVRVKDSAAIHHVFDKNGLYAVTVQVLRAEDNAELARATTVANIRDHVASIPMVRVNAGNFIMGSDKGVDQSEAPAHQVTLTRNLMVGVYELRQFEWNSVLPTSPSWFQGDSLPVESVSWYAAVDFCNRLSLREGLNPAYSINGDTVQCFFSSTGYRLPTEAEWEYMARAGTLTDFYSGAEAKPYAGCLSGDSLESVIDRIAWCCLNSGGCTHQCGQKIPNAFGLYDVIGNVSEWTWDWKDDTFYKTAGSVDPQNSTPGTIKVVRGGDAFSGTIDIRVSSRRLSRTPAFKNYGNGFRVVRTIP